MNSKLQGVPIRSGQHDFLYVISQNEGITQKELSELLYVDKSTTAKAVKDLVSKGYVEKVTLKEDRRFARLYLTDKGRQIKPHIQKTFFELMDIVTSNLSEQEVGQAVSLLKLILDALLEEKKGESK